MSALCTVRDESSWWDTGKMGSPVSRHPLTEVYFGLGTGIVDLILVLFLLHAES